jgi:hypothetical protein
MAVIFIRSDIGVGKYGLFGSFENVKILFYNNTPCIAEVPTPTHTSEATTGGARELSKGHRSYR